MGTPARCTLEGIRGNFWGQITFAELSASVQGCVAHAGFGHTQALRDHVFSTWPVRPAGPG